MFGLTQLFYGEGCRTLARYGIKDWAEEQVIVEVFFIFYFVQSTACATDVSGIVVRFDKIAAIEVNAHQPELFL